MHDTDKLPIAIAVISFIALIFFCNSGQNIDEDLLTANNKKKIFDRQLKMCSEIDKYFGYSSEDFHSDRPIIILRGNGAKDVIRVYAPSKDEIVAYRDPDQLDTGWDGYEENNEWAIYRISSKVSNDYSYIQFKNNVTNKSFGVLVIVK